MKKLLLLLLLVPIVSFGQVQVQGTVPTYENPNPQPIQVQSQNNSYSTSSNNRPIIVNRSTSAPAPLSGASTNIIVDQLKGSAGKYKYLVIKSVSGWAVSGNFVTILTQVNAAKKYSIVSLNDLGMRKIVNNSAGATSDNKRYKKKN